MKKIMRKFQAFNIKYDTDGERIRGLPKTVTFEAKNLEEAQERCADKVSDATGWCVFSLDVKEVA